MRRFCNSCVYIEKGFVQFWKNYYEILTILYLNTDYYILAN